MAEILARIDLHRNVELVDDQSIKIATNLTPFDAAYLARGMLACAAALSGTNPPQIGAIGGDAHLPILSWAVGISNDTGGLVMILSILPGIELTFAITAQGAKEMGNGLLRQTDKVLPPELWDRGTVH